MMELVNVLHIVIPRTFIDFSFFSIKARSKIIRRYYSILSKKNTFQRDAKKMPRFI